MKKVITVLCELNTDLDFVPANAKYSGYIQKITTARSQKTGRFESTLVIKVTDFSRIVEEKKIKKK